MKKILVALVILFILAFIGYRYLYKAHRDIAEEQPAYELMATDLTGAFTGQPETAVSTYLDKTIAVTGKITETEARSLTLDQAVYCEFTENMPALSVGEAITVKGRCIGYDELLDIVKLDQCTMIH